VRSIDIKAGHPQSFTDKLKNGSIPNFLIALDASDQEQIFPGEKAEKGWTIVLGYFHGIPMRIRVISSSDFNTREYQEKQGRAAAHDLFWKNLPPKKGDEAPAPTSSGAPKNAPPEYFE